MEAIDRFMELMVVNPPYILPIIFGVVYAVVVCIVLSSRTTSYKIANDYKDVYSVCRDAEPKDVWMALAWPFTFTYLVFWALLDMLNSFVQYPLLLIGVRYKETNLDRGIRMFISRRT